MTTAPKPFVFVLMPFSKDFEDAYELAIRPACAAAGAYAERVDQQIFAGSIMDRVYNQIAKADIVIGDMSDRNPNVFYEIGYAHALAKTTILVTKNEDDIPFDLRQYQHVIYGGRLAYLKAELERHVRWHVENPNVAATVPEELEVRLNGVRLAAGGEVMVLARGEMNYLALDFAIQNRAERNVRTLTFRAGISTPARLNRATDRRDYEYESVMLDDTRVFMHPGHFTLLPHEWAPIDFRLMKKHDHVVTGETFACSVRVYFDSGSIEIPFQVQIQSPVSAVGADA